MLNARLRGRRAAAARARGRRAARPPGPAWTTRPPSRTTTSRARRWTTGRFCSTSRIVVSSAARSSAAATSVTRSGARPFVGSSTSSTWFPLSSARAIATICCWPPESVPARCAAALAQLGEQVVDEVVARVVVALGEAQVLLHREPREDVAVLGHVPDAAPHDRVGRQPRHVVARERDRRRATAARAPSARGASSSCRRRSGRGAR